MTPRELAQHNCINFRLAATGRVFSWEFEKNGHRLAAPVKGNLTVNSAEVTCFAALRGMGLAQFGTHHAAEHIKAGRLVAVLLDYVCAERALSICLTWSTAISRSAYACLQISSASVCRRSTRFIHQKLKGQTSRFIPK